MDREQGRQHDDTHRRAGRGQHGAPQHVTCSPVPQLVRHHQPNLASGPSPEERVVHDDPTGPGQAGNVGVLLAGPSAGVRHEDPAHGHSCARRELLKIGRKSRVFEWPEPIEHRLEQDRTEERQDHHQRGGEQGGHGRPRSRQPGRQLDQPEHRHRGQDDRDGQRLDPVGQKAAEPSSAEPPPPLVEVTPPQREGEPQHGAGEGHDRAVREREAPPGQSIHRRGEPRSGPSEGQPCQESHGERRGQQAHPPNRPVIPPRSLDLFGREIPSWIRKRHPARRFSARSGERHSRAPRNRPTPRRSSGTRAPRSAWPVAP